MAYLDTGGSAGRAGSAVTRSISRRRNTGRAGSVVSRARIGVPAPKRSSGGGGGSVRRYSGGGGVSSGSSGRYSAPAPPPRLRAGGGAVPNIKNFLGGDTGYQQQLRQFAKALTDFNADVTRRRGSLTSEFGLSQKAMNDQKLRDLEALEDDYGARGLIRSGLYADAVGDYNTEFGQRMTDLQRRQTEALNQLTQESSQFRSQQGLQKQAAREAAIRRRAEKYGL